MRIQRRFAAEPHDRRSSAKLASRRARRRALLMDVEHRAARELLERHAGSCASMSALGLLQRHARP
ncbi:MAG: hypothetical protein MZV64_44315 [Ignavibacteriales bacterium]|nr:hypothetical protein [Ignavibacteriales bacterium]